MNLEELSKFEETKMGQAVCRFLGDLQDLGIEYNVRRTMCSHMRSYGAMEDAHGKDGVEIFVHFEEQRD